MPGLIGTVGVRIDGVDMPSALTTPEAPALQALLAVMAERGVDTVVMEVSSHALALGRVDGIRFAVGGFTNLSRDHLDFHPTMEDYFDAKARLFDPARRCAPRTAVVCVDDDAGRAMARRGRRAPSPSAPTGNAAALAGRGRRAPMAAGRSEFTAVDPAGVHHTGCASGCPARYNVANALLAAGDSGRGRRLARAGVARAARRRGARPARGRSTAGRTSWPWSTTPTSPARCGRCWRRLRRPDRPAGRGVRRRRRPRPGQAGADGRIAAELADLVVVTDDNPRSEDPAAIRARDPGRRRRAGGAAEVVEIGDRREAIRHAVGWAGPGDVVLIAGKGHETGQTRGGQTRPFDDRDELAAALRP